MSDIAIRVENLSKRYPSAWAAPHQDAPHRPQGRDARHDGWGGDGYVRRPIHDLRPLSRFEDGRCLQ